MDKENRLLYIPTNRICRETIYSYYKEALELSKSSQGQIYFSIIESQESSKEVINNLAIKNLNKDGPIKIIHFTFNEQNKFIDSILKKITVGEKDKLYLKSLLLPQGISYGAGPNKAALLAAALNINTLHRRDSDTYPDTYKNTVLYPSFLECQYSGKTLRDVKDKLQLKKLFPYKNNSIIYFVGSDYLGDSPLDMEELSNISNDLLIDQKKLDHPDWDIDRIRSRVTEYFLNRNPKKYKKDESILDEKGLTEMGISCTYKLFKYLPEMPIKNALGCDYMQKNLLYRLKYPIIYHNRRGKHKYSDERGEGSDDDYFVDYNLRNVRFKLVMKIRSKHNKYLEENLEELISEKKIINSEFYIHSFQLALNNMDKKELLVLVDGISNIYKNAYEQSNKKIKKFVFFTNELQKLKETLIGDVFEGITDYCNLIKHWDSLIIAAKNTDIKCET